MLSKREVLLRSIVALLLFLLPGIQVVNGSTATVCGIIGTIEFASAILHYSPIVELLDKVQAAIRTNNCEQSAIKH